MGETVDADSFGAAVAQENGWTDYAAFSNGRDACIARLLFTYAVLSDLGRTGYGDRWCYSTYEEARASLREWTKVDGEGEPQGWHRHPLSGRRRPDGDASRETIKW